jgi:hypothetical protein
MFVGGEYHGKASYSIPESVIAFNFADTDGSVQGFVHPLAVVLSGKIPDYTRISENAFVHSSILHDEDKINRLIDELNGDTEPETCSHADGYAAALRDIQSYIAKRLAEFN